MKDYLHKLHKMKLFSLQDVSHWGAHTRACHGLVVLPDGRLDERDLGEDGLQQGGGDVTVAAAVPL